MFIKNFPEACFCSRFCNQIYPENYFVTCNRAGIERIPSSTKGLTFLRRDDRSRERNEIMHSAGTGRKKKPSSKKWEAVPGTSGSRTAGTGRRRAPLKNNGVRDNLNLCTKL